MGSTRSVISHSLPAPQPAKSSTAHLWSVACCPLLSQPRARPLHCFPRFGPDSGGNRNRATYLLFAKSFFAKISQMEFPFGKSFVAKQSAIIRQIAKCLFIFRRQKMLLFRQMVSDYGTCGCPNGPNRCVPNPRYGHDGVRAWSCGSEN